MLQTSADSANSFLMPAPGSFAAPWSLSGEAHEREGRGSDRQPTAAAAAAAVQTGATTSADATHGFSMPAPGSFAAPWSLSGGAGRESCGSDRQPTAAAAAAADTLQTGAGGAITGADATNGFSLETDPGPRRGIGAGGGRDASDSGVLRLPLEVLRECFAYASGGAPGKRAARALALTCRAFSRVVFDSPALRPAPLSPCALCGRRSRDPLHAAAAASSHLCIGCIASLRRTVSLRTLLRLDTFANAVSGFGPPDAIEHDISSQICLSHYHALGLSIATAGHETVEEKGRLSTAAQPGCSMPMMPVGRQLAGDGGFVDGEEREDRRAGEGAVGFWDTFSRARGAADGEACLCAMLGVGFGVVGRHAARCAAHKRFLLQLDTFADTASAFGRLDTTEHDIPSRSSVAGKHVSLRAAGVPPRGGAAVVGVVFHGESPAFRGYPQAVATGIHLGGPRFETEGQCLWTHHDHGLAAQGRAAVFSFRYTDEFASFSGLRHQVLASAFLHLRKVDCSPWRQDLWDHREEVAQQITGLLGHS
eukprot:gene16166-24764_t